jgi:hypothetical protein
VGSLTSHKPIGLHGLLRGNVFFIMTVISLILFHEKRLGICLEHGGLPSMKIIQNLSISSCVRMWCIELCWVAYLPGEPASSISWSFSFWTLYLSGMKMGEMISSGTFVRIEESTLSTPRELLPETPALELRSLSWSRSERRLEVVTRSGPVTEVCSCNWTVAWVWWYQQATVQLCQCSLSSN